MVIITAKELWEFESSDCINILNIDQSLTGFEGIIHNKCAWMCAFVQVGMGRVHLLMCAWVHLYMHVFNLKCTDRYLNMSSSVRAEFLVWWELKHTKLIPIVALLEFEGSDESGPFSHAVFGTCNLGVIDSMAAEVIADEEAIK